MSIVLMSVLWGANMLCLLLISVLWGANMLCLLLISVLWGANLLLPACLYRGTLDSTWRCPDVMAFWKRDAYAGKNTWEREHHFYMCLL